MTGWVCMPGRRTITAMITVADPAGRRAHDAYHRFVRDGVWAMSRPWQVLATHLVARFAAAGTVELARDDTLLYHEGRHVEGAGTFRGAVRSTLAKVVHAHGLNLVVITLQVRPPWDGYPIAVPVNMRVRRKEDAVTTIGHAAAMLPEIAGWLPGRQLHLCADGAYATLARDLPDPVHLTCRMRRDAALHRADPLTDENSVIDHGTPRYLTWVVGRQPIATRPKKRSHPAPGASEERQPLVPEWTHDADAPRTQQPIGLPSAALGDRAL